MHKLKLFVNKAKLAVVAIQETILLFVLPIVVIYLLKFFELGLGLLLLCGAFIAVWAGCVMSRFLAIHDHGWRGLLTTFKDVNEEDKSE